MNGVTTVSTPFGGYRCEAGVYDECHDEHGKLRPAWQGFARRVDRGGSEQLAQYTDIVNASVHESAVAFGFHGAAKDQPRPWQLSTIPLLLQQSEWQTLADGLSERTLVLEAVLDDLLGPQRLIKERVIPPELVWANPLFNRAYSGLPKLGGLRLHLTATDLARNSDGAWWVVGDRTRAPSGLGYLLQNRIVTSRVLSKSMRQNNVQRLARFFDHLRDRLVELAPRRRDNPRIAILTPGQSDYRYFEDAYLARYLGIELVQGLDLAMRRQRLHLKTLEGLLPIETVWRHVSDAKCDPLELNPDSRSGVTGLLEAVRAGEVAVLNSIGSVLAQMPALMPFLPAAAKFLQGIELKLPTIATYWCGGKKELEFVLKNLDGLLIRSAFHGGGELPIDPRELSASEREHLVAQLRANPAHFVAQQHPQRSTTPVFSDGKLQPWSMALRAFHLQTDKGVEVLPGGMVRVDPRPGVLDHSHVSGKLGQDCWIVSDSPVDSTYTRLPAPHQRIELRRSGAELTSRVAENLFWLGRYVERSESTSRLLRTTLQRIAGESDPAQLPEVPRLFAALAAIGHLEPDYSIDGLLNAMPTPDQGLPASLFDREQPFGLHSSIAAMTEKASAARDRISLDAYRVIDQVSTYVLDPSLLRQKAEASQHDESRGEFSLTLELLNRVVTGLLAFSGLANESITRTHGWRFLQLGRRIERAYQTAELLAATLVHPIEFERPLIESVLDVTDSLMTYRSRYLSLIQAGPVFDLLVTDDTNPRSLRYQLKDICALIQALPDPTKTVRLGKDESIALDLHHLVRSSDPYALAECHPKTGRLQLLTLLERLIELLPELSNAITARYLIHTDVATALTGRVAHSPQTIDAHDTHEDLP